MKYNKQLFDQINDQYNQLFALSEFIFDQLIEKTEDIKRYDVMCDLDLYVQGLLAKIILLNDPKNPALFNMLKKLCKYTSFYQGINLDDWFGQKEKVLNNISKKVDQYTSNIPVVVQIVAAIDGKSKTTEFSYQILESLIGLALTIIPEQKTFEDIENEVINKYLREIYTYIQTALE